MVGGCSRVTKDIPPYMLCGPSDGDVRVAGPNVVGLTRRGFPKEAIAALREAVKILYHAGLNRSQALERIGKDVEQTEEVKYLLDFYRNSERGVF